MEGPIKPILLLADSQLLFWREEDRLYLERVKAWLDNDPPKAAYVGASNGDQLEFYQLFRGAMEGLGITDCRMIPSEPSPADLEFFAEADLILLAGGDVLRGLQVLRDNGLAQKVIERYYTGAVLVGVSAGAVQLGLFGRREGEGEGEGNAVELFETIKLVPFLIDVHDEPDWSGLAQSLPQAGEHIRGVGIPSGGGALVHADKSLEPVRRPILELRLREGQVERAFVFPPAEGEAGEPGEAAAPPEILH